MRHTEPMTSLDLSRLSTQDAIAALRSYPRRYRSAIAPIRDDENVEAFAHQIGPEGVSALDLLLDAVRTFAILGRALHQITIEDRPVLHAAVLDPGERVWEDTVTHTVDSALQELASEVDDLVPAIERTASRDWERTGTIAGSGQELTAFDVVREAVRTGSDDLRRIEETLKAVRGR